MEQLTTIILNSALSILAIFIGLAVKKFRVWIEAKAGLAGVRVVEIVASNVVNAAEQIFKDKDVSGKEKLAYAERMAVDILQANGINVSLQELRIAIEAQVKVMNDSWNSTKELPIEAGVIELLPVENDEHEVIIEE